DDLHWVPRGPLGLIDSLIHPGGVTSTVLGFLAIATIVDLYNHWLHRTGLLAEATEVTPTTFSGIYPLVEELRARFSLPTTRVFVHRTASSSYSLGLRQPHIIVMPAAWLGILTPDELRFALGHEMGHIKLGHTITAPFVGGGGEVLL